MRDGIVKELEEQINNPFGKQIRDFLLQNSFPGNTIVIEWLKKLFKHKIFHTKQFFDFETETNPVLNKTLNEGDYYYLHLFRENNFIKEDAMEKETQFPLTEIVKNIYGCFILKNNSHSEPLLIYSELRCKIENEVGRLLANDPTLQSYEHWLLINEELDIEYNIFSTWVSNIPLNSINKEKYKFSLIPKGTLLSDIANLRSYGRNNEAAAKNYIVHIGKLAAKSAFEYIQEAGRSSDLLTLKENLYFRQQLLQRAGILDWLQLTDSLGYANLQDHVFLWIDNLEQYTSIRDHRAKNDKFHTPNEHLLLIGLENYFDFVDRTLEGLYGLSFKRYNYNNSAEIEQFIEVAKNEYERWLSDLIPQSFNQILNSIFPVNELHNSKFFLSFFEWINSHSKLHLSHDRTESKRKLIDLLNKTFQKRLDIHERDRHFLIDNISLAQVNFEGLKKFLSVYNESKSDLAFRDKLYEKYLSFLNSSEFSWHAESNVNFEAALNDAYYFSLIIISYDDGLSKWMNLFHQYKIIHEGWLKGSADYRAYYRESFLLTAGIGIAYNYYSENDTKVGTDALLTVLNMLIKQTRSCNEKTSIDYKTPLKFAAIAAGRYSPENSEAILAIVTDKMDSLKYLLIILNELWTNSKNFSISNDLKNRIRTKIDNEFWVIEDRKTEAVLKHELEYYIQLKAKALELCKL